MKMFKRFAAALLAGVMVLAMLTACGGGGGGGGSVSTESKIMSAINTGLGSSYSNNSELQRKVRSALQKVDENGMIKVSDLPSVTINGSTLYDASDFELNETTGDASYVVYEIHESASTTASGVVPAIEVTDKLMKQAEDVKPGSIDDLTDEGLKIDAIGVATYNAPNGKTYVGIALKVSGNIYA